MKVFEESFSLLINKNLFIQWISEDFAYYLGYTKEDLIGKTASLILDKKVLNSLNLPRIFGKVKDSANNTYTGIFITSNVLDRYGEHKGYFIQFILEDKKGEDEEFFIFSSNNSRMQKIVDKALLVASSSIPILIIGETGTGKTSLAKFIHLNSNNATSPFVPVRCPALNDNNFEIELFGYEKGAFAGVNSSKVGKVELAENGTLLFDEIEELSSNLQAKLSIFLDNMEYEKLGSNKIRKANVRIISTSSRNLLGEIEKESFRLDLYYKLAVIKIELLPLRERREDIPLLVNKFLSRKKKKIKPKALKYLMEQDWYGNIRELFSVLETAVILSKDSESIDIQHLTEQFYTFEEIGKLKEQINEPKLSEEKLFNEKERIKIALQKTNGNRKKAAELLGISVPTLWRKMKKYNLLDEFRK
ncbi:MAG: sigma-54-dependent Fis family transcriptional regulator [Persephonella sp.]|nr:MAG: sigma-54-dependent Fis family transcriptional regulator [Persephonella sp.]RUM62375.1 MAG: sigma-54-dependent Fis family transcriptional regulator [Persephonella sp.]